MTTHVYGNLGFIEALFRSGAVGFNYGTLIHFKSGILSPGAYINNRVLQSYPHEWRVVIDQMTHALSGRARMYDTLAAVATGGIAHGGVLAHTLGVPHVTIKKEEKTSHGLGGLIDGDANILKEANVIMVEDMSSTFISTLKAMQPVKDAGASVKGTIVINTWNFPEFQENSADELVLAGCTGGELVAAARQHGLIDTTYHALLMQWLEDPRDQSWVTSDWK